MRGSKNGALLLLRKRIEVQAVGRKRYKQDSGMPQMLRSRKLPRFVVVSPPTGRNLLAALSEAEPGWGDTVLRGFHGVPSESSLLHALRNLGDKADMALSLFRWAAGLPEFRHSTRTCNGTMRALVTGNKFSEARLLLKDGQMCKPDAVTILTEGLCKAGRAAEALEVLEEMVDSGVNPLYRTSRFVLEQVSMSGNVSLAMQHLDRVEKASPPKRALYITMVSNLCKSGEVEGALVWFQRGHERHNFVFAVRCFNLLIRVLCKSGQAPKAREVFQLMVSSQGKAAPELFTYTALIDGLSKAGMLNEGKLVLRSMICEGCRPDAVTCCSLIYELCKACRRAEAVDIFTKMDGVAMDTLVYNALIHSYCKAGRLDTGLYYLNHMLHVAKCQPNAYTFNSVLLGLCRTSGIDRGLVLLSKVVKDGDEPGIVSRNLLMDRLCRKKRVLEALDMFRELPVQPTVVTYNLLINGLCKAEMVTQACSLFHEMPISEANVITYNTLIAGLCKARRLQEASSYFHLMKQSSSVEPNLITYKTLVDGFCRACSFDEACSFLVEMTEMGHEPGISLYNAVVIGLLKQGKLDKCRMLLVKHPSARDEDFDLDEPGTERLLASA